MIQIVLSEFSIGGNPTVSSVETLTAPTRPNIVAFLLSSQPTLFFFLFFFSFLLPHSIRPSWHL